MIGDDREKRQGSCEGEKSSQSPLQVRQMPSLTGFRGESSAPHPQILPSSFIFWSCPASQRRKRSGFTVGVERLEEQQSEHMGGEEKKSRVICEERDHRERAA